MDAPRSDHPPGERRRSSPQVGLAVVIVVTGVCAIAADLLSAWSDEPGGMGSPVAVDFDSVRHLFVTKPRWHYVLGNFLGVFVMPVFHLAGMYLVALSLQPLGKPVMRWFLFVGAYVTSVGAGLHGTLAFVGDIVRSGSDALMLGMLDYWQPWAYALVTLLLVVSLLLAAAIAAGKTLHPRWVVVLSPLPVMAASTLAILALPTSSAGARAFLAVTGLNLPMLVFYVATLMALWRREDARADALSASKAPP